MSPSCFRYYQSALEKGLQLKGQILNILCKKTVTGNGTRNHSQLDPDSTDLQMHQKPLPHTKQETQISDLHGAWELHWHADMVNLKSGKGKNKANGQGDCLSTPIFPKGLDSSLLCSILIKLHELSPTGTGHNEKTFQRPAISSNNLDPSSVKSRGVNILYSCPQVPSNMRGKGLLMENYELGRDLWVCCLVVGICQALDFPQFIYRAIMSQVILHTGKGVRLLLHSTLLSGSISNPD